MDEIDCESISSSLCQIAQVHKNIDQLNSLLHTFYSELKQQQEGAEFLNKCEQTSNNLVNEIKVHTEELRLINQDINHLEDLVKNIRNSYSPQKLNLSKRFHHFQRNLQHYNQNICELKLPNECLLSEKELMIEAPPQWLFEQNISNQQFVNPNAMAMNPMIGLSKMFAGENNQFINRFAHIFQQAGPSFVGRSYHEDPSKQKQCQFCQRDIHRNAPVCPYCKMKNSSLRNPRRPKKKTNS